MNSINGLKILAITMFFWSFIVTSLTYVLPSDFQDSGFLLISTQGVVDLDETTGQFRDNLEKQTAIPAIDVGALVFYSGNYILDLALNFVFAIPNIVSSIFNGFVIIFSLPVEITALVLRFNIATMSVLYILGIMNFVTKLRAGAV